jgi:anti-sigma B factor antagonist
VDTTVLDPTTSQLPTTDGDGWTVGIDLRVDRPAADSAVLTVHGEIDSLTAPQLEPALVTLLDGPERRLVIDLSEVTFLASSGLAALIRTAQLVEERGERLRLVVANRAVRRPLQVTGSDQLFDLFDDLPSSLDARIGDSV